MAEVMAVEAVVMGIEVAVVVAGRVAAAVAVEAVVVGAAS